MKLEGIIGNDSAFFDSFRIATEDMKMENYTTRVFMLTCGTVGNVELPAARTVLSGDIVTVELHDDNGRRISVRGIVDFEIFIGCLGDFTAQG